MKLTYWACRHLTDSQVYNIRERTRAAAKAKREEYGPENYAPPVKVTVEYRDAFDLLTQALDESGIYEGDPC